MKVISSPMSSKNQLRTNIISLYVLQGLNLLLPMIVLPYLIRVLGADNFGKLIFFSSLTQLCATLTDYGFNLTATQQVAVQRHDRAAVSEIFWSVQAVKVCLMFGSFFITLLALPFIPGGNGNWKLYLAIFMTVPAGILCPVWYFQGLEAMRVVTIVTGIARIISSCLIFWAVKSRSDLLLAALIQSTGSIVSGVICIPVICRYFPLDWVMPHKEHLIKQIKHGWHIFISTIATSLYTSCNAFLLGLITGSTQTVGYFGAADKLIRALSNLYTPLAQAIFPRINTLASISRPEALRFIHKSMKYTFLPALFGSLALLALAPWGTRLLFGAAYTPAVPVIRWLALLPFLTTVSNILGIQTMLTFGLRKEFSRILITSALMNVCLFLPLAHYFYEQGAGAAILITEVCVVLAMYRSLRQHGVSIKKYIKE